VYTAAPSSKGFKILQQLQELAQQLCVELPSPPSVRQSSMIVDAETDTLLKGSHALFNAVVKKYIPRIRELTDEFLANAEVHSAVGHMLGADGFQLTPSGFFRMHHMGSSGTAMHSDLYWYLEDPTRVPQDVNYTKHGAPSIYTAWFPLQYPKEKNMSTLRMWPDTSDLVKFQLRPKKRARRQQQQPMLPSKWRQHVQQRRLTPQKMELELGQVLFFPLTTVHDATPHENPHEPRVSFDRRIYIKEDDVFLTAWR
jgi:ectoine hydroxylase-related dioxygenase (phytanoyl-CoA dioxygenase family)